MCIKFVFEHRFEDRGLVRHKGNYWALGEDDEVAGLRQHGREHTGRDDRFGEEDMDEWLEHAVDDTE